MKAKAILLITAIVVIALTILTYNVSVDVWTSNLQISATVVCVSELAIFCTMGLLPVINFKNGSTGLMVNIYAGLMILWSLFGINLDGNGYPIGLLAISAVMFVFIGMSVTGSHESNRLNDEVEHTIYRKQSYTESSATISIPSTSTPQVDNRESLTSMWRSMQTSIEDYDTRKRVKALIERIQAMPASSFPNAHIEHSMREIAAVSRTLSKAEDTSEINERINLKIKELNNYIKSL